MLKKPFSGVLASFKVSTYTKHVRLDLSLAAALLKCFLNIRNDFIFCQPTFTIETEAVLNAGTFVTGSIVHSKSFTASWAK